MGWCHARAGNLGEVAGLGSSGVSPNAASCPAVAEERAQFRTSLSGVQVQIGAEFTETIAALVMKGRRGGDTERWLPGRAPRGLVHARVWVARERADLRSSGASLHAASCSRAGERAKLRTSAYGVQVQTYQDS